MPDNLIDSLYKWAKETPSDINDHIEYLRDLASECDHVTEMGVRYMVSTWAFLEGLKAKHGTLVSIDMVSPEYYGIELNRVIEHVNKEGVNFSFRREDTLKVDIEPTDLLFIDTTHENDQVTKELARHADKARKYIAFHDTVSCKDEMMPPIEKFLAEHSEWTIHTHREFNNGLLVLKRIV